MGLSRTYTMCIVLCLLSGGCTKSEEEALVDLGHRVLLAHAQGDLTAYRDLWHPAIPDDIDETAMVEAYRRYLASYSRDIDTPDGDASVQVTSVSRYDASREVDFSQYATRVTEAYGLTSPLEIIAFRGRYGDAPVSATVLVTRWDDRFVVIPTWGYGGNDLSWFALLESVERETLWSVDE